jgi:Uma2 family endonuclease
MVQKTRISLTEFLHFATLPENEDRVFELVYGRIIEKLPVTTYLSSLSHLIAYHVHMFCREHHVLCHTSGWNGPYGISEHILLPDFAYKPTSMSDDYPDPDPPLWVVEVISPTEKAIDVRDKRHIYGDAHILYWELYSTLRLIDVYAPGQPPRTVDIDGTLDGGDVLPEFTLALRELFRDE